MIRISAATVAVLAAMAVAVAWLQPDLPAQVATHWGVGGVPDGFTDSGRTWVLVAVPAVVALLMLPLAMLGGRLPSAMHWLVGVPVGVAVGMAVMLVGSLVPQRGLADAAEAVFPGWLVPLGVAAGLLATMAAARLVPARRDGLTSQAAPDDAVRARLPGDRVVVWHGTTPAAPAIAWLGAGVLGLGIGVSWLVSWWLLAVFVPAVALLLASSQFDVTVGPTGVRASGIGLGWPRVQLPLGTITGADTTSTAFHDFGGWGLRMRVNLQEMGVITRNGPALRLYRTDGVAVVISMERPEPVAGVVNSLLDRRAVAPDGQ